MGDELQPQSLRRRPGQRVAGGGQAPSLEVAEVGGERPQGVGAHAGAGEVLEGGGVLVGEEDGEALAGVERQKSGEGVEVALPGEGRIREEGRGGIGHRGRASAGIWTAFKPIFEPASIIIDKGTLSMVRQLIVPSYRCAKRTADSLP